jgi:alpha-amylase/alpha-mannosidase (GH57 family)
MDPWLAAVLPEGSAAPCTDWNQRITRESYAPLARARRLDNLGRISEVLNCYEWMSFNAGPTLLNWMAKADPDLVSLMVRADRASIERLGHGNALAQAYHHMIMPLATAEDRAIEIRWAIDDFRHYFGREPEGMWLPECAADLPTLESLAGQGIRFVILAPRQAAAVVENGTAFPVNERSLKAGEPYRVALPSGKSITAVFYHGGVSQAIAFEGLLRNGENFWQRIVGEAGNLARQGRESSLLTLATDGETYGHHFTFGEMALAYVLAQGASGRDNIHLTNLPAYIAAHPPVREVLIREPSSWSCAHGVERWRGDCGCTDGGHPGWNQRWRGPLRSALDVARDAVKQHFFTAGQECFKDAGAALAAYGEVLAAPQKAASFAAAWFTGNGAVHDKAWKLLACRNSLWPLLPVAPGSLTTLPASSRKTP